MLVFRAVPGEDVRDFEPICQMMIDDIQPEANIEWLLTLDLVELSLEIYCCQLKQTILEIDRGGCSRTDNMKNLFALSGY